MQNPISTLHDESNSQFRCSICSQHASVFVCATPNQFLEGGARTGSEVQLRGVGSSSRALAHVLRRPTASRALEASSRSYSSAGNLASGYLADMYALDNQRSSCCETGHWELSPTMSETKFSRSCARRPLSSSRVMPHVRSISDLSATCVDKREQCQGLLTVKSKAHGLQWLRHLC